MVKVGKWIAKHKYLIILISILLMIPSVIGMAKTRVNYDILSYLPDTLETIKGQDIMVDEYGMGAFSMVVVENMELKDVQKLEDAYSEIDHVKDVLWYDDVADLSLPVEMIPKDLREAFFKGDATMMLVLFDNTTSSDEAMEALTEMRKISNDQCFLSGMTGIVTDIKNLALSEMPAYVVIAAILCFIVLQLFTDSFLVPLFFLLSIGISILYNMGTNVFLGEISYITQALVAVLQLGVTMDYSIFLLSSYEENKERFPDDRERAMGHAIANTFKSIVGSSVTTIAGFAALCFMTFALGRDLGIVSAKGVVIGVICCVTVLPAMILIFDKPIEKTKHKPLIKSMDRLSGFITKHYKIWLVIFLVLLTPAIYGNSNTKIYYNIAKSLPSTLESNVANEKLEEDFDMSVLHMVMMDKNMDAKDKRDMLNAIDKVNAENVFIFPNNSNIILAANQAQSIVEDKNIIVIPTKTIPQGISALIAYSEEASPEENTGAMTEEIANIKSGSVTYAVRDTEIDDKTIKQGDIMGIGDKTILSVGQNIQDVTKDMIEQLAGDDAELISIYYGSDVTEEDANALAKAVEAVYPDVDVEVNYGGQPIYYYILSVE